MKRLQLILSFRLTIARQEKINWRRIYVEIKMMIKYYTADGTIIGYRKGE